MSGLLQFDANDSHLSDVIFSQRKFRVPRYQRPYAWDIDEVSQFWEDLLNNEEPYFFGSFIFNREAINTEGYVDIIDGQQRLLTITILIAVLRDIAKDIEPDIAKRFQRQDIAIEDRDGNQSYRILPADSLFSFFSEVIQNFEGNALVSVPATQEEARVKRIYDYLHQQVNNSIKEFINIENKSKFLETIRKRIASLIIINVEIDREDDAYEIFETTNARGLDLSVADLLKNLVFKKIKPNEDKDFAKEVWQDIVTDIESTGTDMKRFIRYFWISKYAFLQEKRLYRAIKGQVTDWDQFLGDLWKSSSDYNLLLEGNENDFNEFSHGNEIYQSIYALRIMNVSQCYVFLLAILRNYKSLHVDPIRIIKVIENFTFQYSAVCKLPGNKVEKLYSGFALEIENILTITDEKHIATNVNRIFQKLEVELKKIAPSETLFKESFSNIEYRNAEQSRLFIKYVLSRINAYLEKTDEHKINFASVNVEHILPQNPHKEWGLSKSGIKLYVHKLGNLTIISERINSKLQNCIIEKKLPDMKRSTLKINKDLVDLLEKLENKWDQEEIIHRQILLGEIAFNNVWRL